MRDLVRIIPRYLLPGPVNGTLEWSRLRDGRALVMRIASWCTTHMSDLSGSLGALALFAGFAFIAGCSSGYQPARTRAPDIDALLTLPQYSEVRIVHQPDAARTFTTTVTAGTVIMEYLMDDKLVGSHSVHRSFDETFNVLGGDHELVVQQCYRGLLTLGGRSCEYIKYHFRIHPGERGRVKVAQPNVLRPKTAGFLQWHEIEGSRY